MNILAELNSIGAGFDVPTELSRRLPEDILIESLNYAYEQPLIAEIVFAILDYHKALFDAKMICRALNRLIKVNGQRSSQALVFAYAVLSKTMMLDNNHKKMIKDYLGTLKAEDIFPSYNALKSYAISIGEKDPVLEELGLILPIVQRAPNKKIRLNPANLRAYNTVMRKRICEHCLLPTAKEISSLVINDKSSPTYFYHCRKCGFIPAVDIGRIRRSKLEFVKKVIGVLKYERGLKEKQIAECLGITPEHLSNVKNGRYPLSSTCLNILKLLMNSSENVRRSS